MEDLTTVTGFFRHSFRSSLTSSGVSVRVSLHSFLLPRSSVVSLVWCRLLPPLFPRLPRLVSLRSPRRGPSRVAARGVAEPVGRRHDPRREAERQE